MRTNPNERPDFLELRKKTKEGVDRLEGIFGEFKSKDPPLHLWVETMEDEFKIGTKAVIPTKKRKRGLQDEGREGVDGGQKRTNKSQERVNKSQENVNENQKKVES